MIRFMRTLCLSAVLLTPLPGQKTYLIEWRQVADRLLDTPVERYPFNWGEGVQQIGLMKVYERTAEARYADYMERWARLYVGRDVRDLLNIGEVPGSKERRGYCGHWSPATAILLLDQARPNAAYRRLPEQVAEHISKKAERSPEGGLGHWDGSHQLWVDTLYMACPLLAGLGKREYVEDAAQQILVYARHLQDERTGLFYHMWDWQTGERTKDAWGRGNGWVLMSLADTLEALPPNSERRKALLSVLSHMMSGLRKTQDAEGLWHTVMDDPASYPESSATAMVSYAVLKLIRLGVLAKSDAAMALKAWRAVNEKYVQNGVVTGVSAGTVPKDRAYYRGVGVGSQTWGTGAYLLAGSEVARRTPETAAVPRTSK